MGVPNKLAAKGTIIKAIISQISKIVSIQINMAQV